MNKFQEMEEKNAKLFDAPLKEEKKLQTTYGKKILLITAAYRKKAYRGLVVVCATATEENLNCFIDTVIDGKRKRVFIELKLQYKDALEIIGAYTHKL